jgi:threonine/homoserine/homoserine lactone efflux protein
MASQPCRHNWLYAWDCSSHLGEHIGVISPPQYERTGLFHTQVGGISLFALPGVEYVARSRSTDNQTKKHGKGRYTDHHEGDCDQLTQPEIDNFLFAFLPLFISKNSSSPTMEMMLLSAVFMGITLIVFALYGVLASGISAYLLNSSATLKRLQQAFAIILAGFAVKLALSEK